jgi:FkbM family methyltransferase
MDTNQYMIDNALSGVFFDIGANVGFYTVPMSMKATKVYAFEPSILNYNSLAAASSGCKNVVTEKMAVSNSKGTVKLFAAIEKDLPVGWGGFSINPEIPALPHLHRSFENFEEVPTITLDEYCATNNIINITGMKIDVEAAEQFVLEGALKTLKNNNILISLETHVAIDCQKIYNLLTESGYSVYQNGINKVENIDFDQQYICRK